MSAELGLEGEEVMQADPSPLGTPRAPSRHGRPSSSNSPLRPSSARSLKPRPATPGSPTVTTEVKVDTRPITHQGMISMRSSFQGPGRQILDKSYYVGKLRTKKHELQQEIDRMVEEIEQLEKARVSTAQYEQRQNVLMGEVKSLKLQLGDYNKISEKVNAGVEFNEMKGELGALKEKNMKERKKVDNLFLERTMKEREAKAILDKAQALESDIKQKINIMEAPELQAQFIELQEEYKKHDAEVGRLQQLIEEKCSSNQELEQRVSESSPTKQKVVMLTEQLLTVEGELEKLKTECPSTQLTAEEAKEALISKVRQDNMEIMKADEKSKALEKDVNIINEKIADAERTISELKGGRVEKFLEMQQKERKMQHFIENFENIRSEQEQRTSEVQQTITQLLQQISQGIVAAESYKISKTNHDRKFDEIENYKRELEFHRGELKQLDDFEAKTEADISSTKHTIALLENEIENFKHLDGSRSQSDARCAKLEAERSKVEEKRSFLQEQVKEQIEKLEAFSQILAESEHYKKLQELKSRLQAIHDTNRGLQEEVEAKDRELNYNLVLENIRFMVSQLNNEIKSNQMQ